MEVTKNESKSIQGIAILAMLSLHLFCRHDYNGLYEPLLFFRGYPISYYFALISDYCVVIFAFCSGYGHYQLANSKPKDYMKGRLRSLIKLLFTFWVILILFSGVGFLLNNSMVPGSFKEFCGNFFLYNLSYNGAWWYLLTYIFIVLTSLIIIRFVKWNVIISMLVLGGVYICSYYLRFQTDVTNPIIRQLYLYGMTIFEYALGVVFADKKCFTKVRNIGLKINKFIVYIIGILIFIGMALFHVWIIPSLIIAPVTGAITLILIHMLYEENRIFKILKCIGDNSTNMWLTHMFFIGEYSAEIIYKLKYPIIIYCALIVITLILSVIIKKIILFIEGNHL